MIRIADLFCGAGGESTGILQALAEMGERVDLAAVNHWDIAIRTHRHNHPKARHFCASIQSLNPLDVVRSRDTLDLLWASPECTHHSNARGGRPCSDQSRASAWLICKWLSELYVRRVILENVPEFINWGTLGADGRPLASQKGVLFRQFVSNLESLGYRVEWQLLNAANYGAATTRTRFFLQAVKRRSGERIRWPEPTHAERPGLLGEKPWRAAREVIDWNIRGESIFNRKRPLAPATMARIEAGIRRYWGAMAEPFLVILRGTSTTREASLPMPTITAGGGHVGVVRPFVLTAAHGGRTREYERPLPTVTCNNQHGIVQPFILHQMTPGRPRRVTESLPSITTQSGHGIVEPFICTAGGATGQGRTPKSIRKPMPTVLTNDRHGVVEPFLVHYYGNGQAVPVRVPLATVTGKDHFGLVEGQPVGLDITFRMLKPHELAAAMSFPADYWFAGTQSDQVKQIGNAVDVRQAKVLALSALVAA